MDNTIVISIKISLTKDIFVHTPSRAVNVPGTPSRAAFMMTLESQDLADSNLELPYNLPMSMVRVPGTLPKNIGSTGSTKFDFEMKILVGRISDLYQGDPLYEDRQTGIIFCSIYFKS